MCIKTRQSDWFGTLFPVHRCVSCPGELQYSMTYTIVFLIHLHDAYMSYPSL